MALSLRTKIVLVSALPLLAIHLLVFNYSLHQFRAQSLKDLGHWLEQIARLQSRQLGAGLAPQEGLAMLRRIRDRRGVNLQIQWTDADGQLPDSSLADTLPVASERVRRLNRFDGRDGSFVLVTADVPGIPEDLALIISEASLMSGVEGQVRWLTLLVTLSASITLLMIWAVATRITEPLEDLNAVVREIAAGNLTVVPKIQRSDEMGRLAQTIGSMARRVEQRDGELRLARDNLERRVAERTRELTREISRRQRVEAELLTAKEAAQQASQAKSDFLSNMSHELRTPLNGVLGYAQLLRRDSELSDQQRNNLLAIEHCGEHLLLLINDVLDLAKIEAGRMSVDLAAVDLEQLLCDVRDIVAHRARGKGLNLILDADPTLPRAIRTDSTKLRQILLNLLGNAIKFTAAGEIRLAVAAEADFLSFTVSDTGIGIEAEDLTAIFEAFGQAGSGLQSDGTGLGLAINQHLIVLMGGEAIQVESTPGKGSRFSFRIPLDALSDAELPESPSISDTSANLALARGQTARVLVVDDSADSRDILRQVLDQAGLEPTLAADARTALSLLRSESFELVIMDIRMPGMSGLDAIASIRADPELADLPVIAITASVLPELMSQTRDAGFDDVIGKPFRIEDLLRRAAALLGLELQAVATASDDTGRDRIWPIDIARDAAQRIEDAAMVGDVTALGDIADELETALGGADATLERIRQLIRNFDFAGLEAIAAQLGQQQRTSPEA